jgi:hypothetical protein
MTYANALNFPSPASSGTIARANGTVWAASTATYPDTAAQGDASFTVLRLT